MIRFNKILLYTASILLLGGLAACGQKETQAPNIVIIFTDDQGYADLGCYGATSFQTPSIDRLAEEGARFTSFYVSEAVCSASRSSLLTGCYAQRVGIRGALSPFAMTGLNRNETTIASMLKEQGYATCMVGKWHLGSQMEFYPTKYGFDEYLGIPYSNDMWPVGYDGLRLSEGYKSVYPELPLIHNDSIIGYFPDLKAQDSITSIYTRKAIEFIKAKQNQPFFLYLAHSMVHVPLGVDERFRGSSEQGMYGDVMQEIDWSVGKIMKTLQDLNLDNNTLVIFTSDNGPWLNFGNHAGSAFPLREGKGNAWEGGVRVPCVMHLPGTVQKGIQIDELASTMDILPTIASLTGASLPENYIDGVDILPLLMGIEGSEPRNEFLYYYEGGLCAVRRGDWKLVLPHKYRSYAGVEPGMDGLPGPYSRGQAGIELYNLLDDIGEANNLALDYPEKVEELLAMADSARAALGDRISGIRGRDNRSPGRIRVAGDRLDHKARDKQYALRFEPSHRYPGGSKYALTDGYLGSLEFSDESWLGFHGDDLEVYLDLGGETEIKKISINFLSNQVSWIFLPYEIEVLAGKEANLMNPLDISSFGKTKKDFTVAKRTYEHTTKVRARYIKIIARNVGKCPDWHPGKGENAWVFVDEIVIE